MTAPDPTVRGLMRCGPSIFDAYRWGAWAECSCGWKGRTVWGAGQASISWGLHVRDVVTGSSATDQRSAAGEPYSPEVGRG